MIDYTMYCLTVRVNNGTSNDGYIVLGSMTIPQCIEYIEHISKEYKILEAKVTQE